MQVVENSPQNARNCTVFKKFLGGHAPPTPIAMARSFAARDMPRYNYIIISNIIKSYIIPYGELKSYFHYKQDVREAYANFYP